MDQAPNLMLDFAAEEALLLRDALMAAFGWNELQAIQYLETMWRQAHQDPHPPELLDAPRQLRPEQDQPLELPDRDREVADPTKQVQDKKKPSIRNFEEDAPPSNVITCCPSQYALQKIVIFEYVELWYFTREGCFEASRLAHSQADDAFSIASMNLAMYTAKIRRHWHDKLKLGNMFNIAIINKNLLQYIVVEVNDAMLGKVSNVTLVLKLPAPTHKCLLLPLSHLHSTPHTLCHGGSL